MEARCLGNLNTRAELFPTLVRSAVLGLENEAARVGGIAAPFIVQLGTSLNSPALPFLIFGATAVSSAHAAGAAGLPAHSGERARMRLSRAGAGGPARVYPSRDVRRGDA